VPPRLRQGPSPWFWVGGAALLAAALRVPFVDAPAYPDEGGYLLVVDQWHRGGAGLYGGIFVDRPPLLLWFWRAASALGGVQPARWLACLLVVGLVALAGVAGRELGGRRGAVSAAIVAAALASTPLVDAYEVDGELLAAPLVMATCACTLVALRRPDPRAQAWLAFAAGVTGVGALLVKQNIADGLVFAVVLVASSAVRGAVPWSVARRLLGWGAIGVGTVALGTAMWAHGATPGISELWNVMYGFRSEAGPVLISQSLTAPMSRLGVLWDSAVASGIVAVTVVFVVGSASRPRRREPVTSAIIAMLMVGLAGLALGGGYWLHYLVGLIPVLALATGNLGQQQHPALRRATEVVVALVVVSTFMYTAASADTATPDRVTEVGLEHVLNAAARPSDTAVALYGHPNVIQAAGLEPGYPYIWSLAMRTLDPRLELLRRTLAGPAAPVWVVEWDPIDSWGLDEGGRLARITRAEYHQVATVCGTTVLLHNGVIRPLRNMPDPCSG
jgi:4-amino-4-deoxy-L-arabinose transferase-like glycosyltransferase